MKSYPTKKLGEVCEIVTGSTPRTSVSAYYGGDTLWAGPTDLDRGIYVADTQKKLTKRGVEEGGARLIPKNSVMVSCIGYIGKVAMASKDMATNQQINTFYPKIKGLDSKYLYYALIFRADEFKKSSSQTTLPIINKTKCSNIEIPLPSIAEQKKIVTRLEGLLGKIKEAKRLRAEAQEAAQNLLPAELQRIFTQRHSNILQNVGMSGDHSKTVKWEEKELGEVVIIQSGFGFPKHLQGKNNGKYPFLKVSDMNLPRNKTEISEWNNMVGEEEKEKMGYKSAPAGTIIFPKIGGAIATNKKRILMQDSIYDNNVMGLIPSKNINSKFLFYWLTGFDLSNWAAGSSLPAITKSRVSETKIPLPPIAEQKKIVARLDSLSEKIKSLRQAQAKTASDFISLEQSILSKSFSG